MKKKEIKISNEEMMELMGTGEQSQVHQGEAATAKG